MLIIIIISVIITIIITLSNGFFCRVSFVFLYLFLTNQNLCQPCLKMLWRIVVRTRLEMSTLRRDSWEKRFGEPPDSGGSVLFFL